MWLPDAVLHSSLPTPRAEIERSNTNACARSRGCESSKTFAKWILRLHVTSVSFVSQCHICHEISKSATLLTFDFLRKSNKVSNNRVEYDIIRKKRKAKDKNVLSCAKSPISLLALTTQRLCSSLTSLTRRCCNPRFFHQIYWACMYKATISVRELTARIATAE